jgi:hypothetical protein
VVSSSPASRASMSSWLFFVAGAGTGAGGGAGGGGGTAGFAAAATAAEIFEGGMSAITGFGAGAAGFSAGLAAAGGGGLAGFSAATGGFASSSAMMRRIEARISSIEGSWTFAGCVISDSRSSTRSHHVVLYQARRDSPVPGASGRRFRRTGLTCPQIKLRSTKIRTSPRPLFRSNKAPQSAILAGAANRSATQTKAMSWH